jgi:hypothetical protein
MFPRAARSSTPSTMAMSAVSIRSPITTRPTVTRACSCSASCVPNGQLCVFDESYAVSLLSEQHIDRRAAVALSGA